MNEFCMIFIKFKFWMLSLWWFNSFNILSLVLSTFIVGKGLSLFTGVFFLLSFLFLCIEIYLWKAINNEWTWKMHFFRVFVLVQFQSYKTNLIPNTTFIWCKNNPIITRKLIDIMFYELPFCFQTSNWVLCTTNKIVVVVL
jgi:hypothetical protein